MSQGFSKTAFIIISALCAFIIFVTPIVGFFTEHVVGVLALGWVIAGILVGILIGCMSEKDYQLNDDFKWTFSKNAPDKEGGVKL